MIILPVPPPPDSILYSTVFRPYWGHTDNCCSPAPSSGAARHLPPARGRLMLRHVFRKQEMRSHQKRTAAPDAVQQSFVSL